MKWNTNEMILLVAAALPHETCNGEYIEVNTWFAAEHTTEQLVLNLYNSTDDQLFLCGFSQDVLPSESEGRDVEVPMLELTCHSGHGLEGATPNECEAYGKLMAALRRKGWNVVPHLKDYF